MRVARAARHRAAIGLRLSALVAATAAFLASGQPVGGRSDPLAGATWLPGAALPTVPRAHAHTVLDADSVQALVTELDRHHQAAAQGADVAARSEAVYQLGETVEAIVELLNTDLASHGQSDVLAQVLVKGLGAYAVRVAISPANGRYQYDLAAYRGYLDLAPRGRRAADARYKLLARRFYHSAGIDPTAVTGIDPRAVQDAMAEEERFLEEHPQHDKAPVVRFFLGVDSYRAALLAADRAQGREHERRARQALMAVTRERPESFESRAASILLEKLAAGTGGRAAPDRAQRPAR